MEILIPRPNLEPVKKAVGRVGARVLLSAMTVGGGAGVAHQFISPQNVEAVGKDCLRTNLLLVGVTSVNNPDVLNRPKNADLADFAVTTPQPEFGIAVATYKEDASNSNSKEHELRGYMEDKGSHRQVIFKFPAGTRSNTLAEDGKSEALQVEYYFENDGPQLNKVTGKMEKPRGKALIKCTETVPALGHRTPPVDELEKVLRDPNHQFRTVASIVNEAMRDFTKQPYNLKPETLDQAVVRKAIRDYMDKQKAAASAPASGSASGGTQNQPGQVPAVPAVPAGPAKGPETAPQTSKPSQTESDQKTKITQLEQDLQNRDIQVKDLSTKSEGSDKELNDLRKALEEAKKKSQGGISLPDLPSLPDFSQALGSLGSGEVANVVRSILDLPARGLDQITEPDVEQPTRGVVDLVGWLAALGLLLNRPARIRTRVGNGVASTWRYPIYGIRLWRHNRAVAAGGPVGAAPVAPPRPFSA